MSDINICDYISHYLKSALSGLGVDDVQAHNIISQLQRNIRNDYGGDRLYVPSVHKLTKKERDQAIIQAWKENQGRNQIATQYQVHRSTVDRVIGHYLNRQCQREGFGKSDWNL